VLATVISGLGTRTDTFAGVAAATPSELTRSPGLVVNAGSDDGARGKAALMADKAL
jgi:hypothetical protein